MGRCLQFYCIYFSDTCFTFGPSDARHSHLGVLGRRAVLRVQSVRSDIPVPHYTYYTHLRDSTPSPSPTAAPRSESSTLRSSKRSAPRSPCQNLAPLDRPCVTGERVGRAPSRSWLVGEAPFSGRVAREERSAGQDGGGWGGVRRWFGASERDAPRAGGGCDAVR